MWMKSKAGQNEKHNYTLYSFPNGLDYLVKCIKIMEDFHKRMRAQAQLKTKDLGEFVFLSMLLREGNEIPTLDVASCNN